MGYDAAGRRVTRVDPSGTVTRSFYDARGRVTHRVENYKPASQYWGTTPGPDQKPGQMGQPS